MSSLTDVQLNPPFFIKNVLSIEYVRLTRVSGLVPIGSSAIRPSNENSSHENGRALKMNNNMNVYTKEAMLNHAGGDS